MATNNYDPKKAHDYYERTKKLKGRQGGSPPTHAPLAPKVGQGSRIVESGNANSAKHPPHVPPTAEAIARVNRLRAAVSKIETALSAARAALSQKRQAATKTAQANSDGKSTQKQKTAAKQYRNKNKAKLATKRKASASSTPASSSTSVSSMSVQDLQARIIKLNSALTNAKRQLAEAQQSLGHMAHSAITSEPTFDEHFARFRSAERRPSV